MTDLNLKAPPHSNSAEQALLGAVMLAGIGKVAHLLTEDDFYRHVHRLIWRACMELDAANERADVVSVAEWFAKQDGLDRVDNGAYLTGLANECPSTSNMVGWAKTIKQKAVLRGLIALSVDLGDRAMTCEDPEAIVSDMTEQLLDWTGKDTFTGPKTLMKHAADWIDQLNAFASDDFERIETGLIDVDRLTMGLMPGELIILAGRPGMGKSAFALQVANHVSRSKPVMLFSLEMSGFELIGRSAAAGVPPERLRDPKQLNAEDWKQIQTGMQLLKRHDLVIDDTAGLAMNQVSARARYAHRKHGLSMIVVDYLQLINATAGSRTEEISVISRALKKLGKDLGVPVIALSQLNRSLESRPDKRPIMSDLRESGQVEQDADQIWFLYRHTQYHPDFGSDIAELIMPKHRHAKPGKAYTLWQGHRTRFVNADVQAITEYRDLLKGDEKPTGRSRFQRLAGEKS